jgi:phage terminase large subunit GpA-like protein
MRSFVNIYAGKEYKDAGTRPRLSAVLTHRGEYASGTVPKGVLFLTMACDVQRGSARDPQNPPRIELEVMGTGLGYRTWSICYRVFEGEVTDPYAGAWENMYNWLESIDYTFYSKGGIPFFIQKTGIDSGDAAEGRAEVVYRFCERCRAVTLPLKGFASLKVRRGEQSDIPGAASFKKYRLSKIGSGGEYVIEVSTAWYKTNLYGKLLVQPSPESFPGYCEFPRDYSDDYFVQLTNFEKRSDGGFRDIGRHEALDCRVYNLMLSDAWLDEQVSIVRQNYRAQGYNPLQVDLQVNSRVVLDNLQGNIAAYGAD